MSIRARTRENWKLSWLPNWCSPLDWHVWKSFKYNLNKGVVSLCCLGQGTPTSRVWCLMTWGRADVIIIEIKCTGNVMHLSHPKTISPSPGHGKIIFHETDPLCQKGWGLLVQGLIIHCVRRNGCPGQLVSGNWPAIAVQTWTYNSWLSSYIYKVALWMTKSGYYAWLQKMLTLIYAPVSYPLLQSQGTVRTEPFWFLIRRKTSNSDSNSHPFLIITVSWKGVFVFLFFFF